MGEIEESQATMPTKKRKKTKENVSFPVADEKWVQHTSFFIDVAKLQWSVTEEDVARSGQIRKIDTELVNRRKADLVTTPPKRFVKVTVVPADPQGV